jgi:hypothetical protein
MKTENTMAASIKKVLIDMEESINQLVDEHRKEIERVFDAKQSIFYKAKQNQLKDAETEFESLIHSDRTSNIKVAIDSLMNAYNVIQNELKEIKGRE